MSQMYFDRKQSTKTHTAERLPLRIDIMLITGMNEITIGFDITKGNSQRR